MHYNRYLWPNYALLTKLATISNGKNEPKVDFCFLIICKARKGQLFCS